ncbi:hypothetical protein [Shinella sp.]|uniref:hypothetical protein n=1 Tax=Shinella sp. TaxID=1870904 RepID=UPI0039E6CE52
MSTLVFYVKGSVKEPYRIIAEGEGENLRTFCNCPAGKKGAAFCKHVAYLLQGDVGKLASPSMKDVTELARRAKGSPLLAKAGDRVDNDISQAEAAGLASVAEVHAKFMPELEDLGWTTVLAERVGEQDKDRMELYARYKNGNLRVRPSITLEFVRFGYEEGSREIDWSTDVIGGSATPATLIPRQKPFGIVRADGGTLAGPWKHLSAALPKFLELARRGPIAKF